MGGHACGPAKGTGRAGPGQSSGWAVALSSLPIERTGPCGGAGVDAQQVAALRRRQPTGLSFKRGSLLSRQWCAVSAGRSRVQQQAQLGARPTPAIVALATPAVVPCRQDQPDPRGTDFKSRPTGRWQHEVPAITMSPQPGRCARSRSWLCAEDGHGDILCPVGRAAVNPISAAHPLPGRVSTLATGLAPPGRSWRPAAKNRRLSSALFHGSAPARSTAPQLDALHRWPACARPRCVTSTPVHDVHAGRA